MSFFDSIFCCCMNRSKSIDVIDENSRLIPAVEDLYSPDIPNPAIVDQQRLRDKWNTIVRSKEGKMINVNAPLPFNFHNQVLPTHFHSSSSRSASTSTNRYSSTYSVPNTYGPTSRNHTSVSRYTDDASSANPNPHRNGMLTPSPVLRSMNLTPASSMSDLRGAARRGGSVGVGVGVGVGGDDGEGEDGNRMQTHVRSPLLGLRLVRPDGVPVNKTVARESRRGRRGRSVNRDGYGYGYGYGYEDGGDGSNGATEDGGGDGEVDGENQEGNKGRGESEDYLDVHASGGDSDPDMTPRPGGIVVKTSSASPSSPKNIKTNTSIDTTSINIRDLEAIAISWQD